MQALSKLEQAEASFREEKTLAMLSEPMVLEGKLFYAAPDRLEKRVLKPYLKTYRIAGNELTLDGERALSLNNYPAVGAVVAAFRATLGGDLSILEHHYRIALEGDERSWKLILKPRMQRLAEVVERIAVAGEVDRIHSIVTYETNGDQSAMYLDFLTER